MRHRFRGIEPDFHDVKNLVRIILARFHYCIGARLCQIRLFRIYINRQKFALLFRVKLRLDAFVDFRAFGRNLLDVPDGLLVG